MGRALAFGGVLVIVLGGVGLTSVVIDQQDRLTRQEQQLREQRVALSAQAALIDQVVDVQLTQHKSFVALLGHEKNLMTIVKILNRKQDRAAAAVNVRPRWLTNLGRQPTGGG